MKTKPKINSKIYYIDYKTCIIHSAIYRGEVDGLYKCQFKNRKHLLVDLGSITTSLRGAKQIAGQLINRYIERAEYQIQEAEEDLHYFEKVRKENNKLSE